MELSELNSRLQELSGVRAKRQIQTAAAVFEHQPFAELGVAACLGDDAALLPAQTGKLLLACEGMQPQLVRDDPWFAGWSAVLVNLNDIAAMGGRPLALVNSLWSDSEAAAAPLLAGMRRACDTFNVPMVGGHTNQASDYAALSVAVLGVADGPPLSARAARAGEALVLLADAAGSFHQPYPFWDAATAAPAARLQAQLALLPRLARHGIVSAAKDISMGGLVGTALMFAEACGLGITIDLMAIERPAQVEELPWLSCFPSFGFLLAVPGDRLPLLQENVTEFSNLICCPIGCFDTESTGVWLRRDDQKAQFWDTRTPLTGFGAVADPWSL